MKKILIAILILISSFSTWAQESKTYLVKTTEWYLYNETTEKWELQDRNTNLNIAMVTYKNVINMQAKTPTLYRLDEDSKEEINGETYKGLRYSAIECVEMRKCTVDFVVLDKSKTIFLFSVIMSLKGEKINLRFFANLE